MRSPRSLCTLSSHPTTSKTPKTPKQNCRNTKCTYYSSRYDFSQAATVRCLACSQRYRSNMCSSCSGVYSNCPHCGLLTDIARNTCRNRSYSSYNNLGLEGRISPQWSTLNCNLCRTAYRTRTCHRCASAFSDCSVCVALHKPTKSKRDDLINEFLDEEGTIYPISTPAFLPRKNTEGCED